jgi:hypothetical protein
MLVIYCQFMFLFYSLFFRSLEEQLTPLPPGYGGPVSHKHKLHTCLFKTFATIMNITQCKIHNLEFICFYDFISFFGGILSTVLIVC